MNKLTPIALVVFSNDLDNYLSNINIERKFIKEAFEHYSDEKKLQIEIEEAVNVSELFRLFNKYEGRIALFHFAGHANGTSIQLNDEYFFTENAQAKGIASLIRREVEEGQLQFVFLNGCSTQPQVEALKKAGVSSIIATKSPINDTKALQFAKHFYRSWANADKAEPFDQPTTLKTAFKTAFAYLETTEKGVEIEETNRGLKLRRTKNKNDFPWILDTTQPDLILPNSKPVEKKKEPITQITQRIQNADKIYNIKHINEATFN